jgi:hypothetical protein
MNWVVERRLMDRKSRRDVISNQLVLVVPKEFRPRQSPRPGRFNLHLCRFGRSWNNTAVVLRLTAQPRRRMSSA